MVFAFAGLSTITSFLAMARDTLAARWDTPCMAPRPSPVYILVAALSWPLLYGLYRLRARGREHLPDGRLRARGEPQLELRPLAARAAALPAAAISASWPSRSSSGPRSSSSRPQPGAFPVRRGERDTEALETAARLCREGHIVVMFPEGTRRQEGHAEEVRGPGTHGRGADRARRRSVPLVPAGIVGTDRLGRLGAAAGRLRAADSNSTTSRAARMRRRSRPSG